MASLEPVYQKVETKDTEEIELEDLNDKKESPVAQPAENKCCKKKCEARAKRVRKCGKCCALTCCSIFLATVFVLSIAFGVAVYRVKHCVYPSELDTKTYVYDPTTLDLLELNIPTGSITVNSCPHATNVTVKVVSGAKSTQLLSEIVLDVKETKNSLSISAKAPSFDLQNCQIMHVYVTVPASSTHRISLSAKADVGLIRLKTKSYAFDKVNLNVNVGVIKARKLSANDISAVTSFGGIMGCTWNATNSVNVKADIGGACISTVNAKQGSIYIDKGVLRARNVEIPKWNATVNYGCMMQRDVQSEVVYSSITYGRMWISPSPKFSGHVVLTSTNNAHFEVTARRGLEVPAVVVENTPGSPPQKWINIAHEQGKDGAGRFNLASTSGSVYVFVTNA